jgi:hypothetical protein
VVLFGGSSASQSAPLEDTWIWDGSAWTEACAGPPCSTRHPAPRSDHVMAYDERRQRIVLFGGESAPWSPTSDVWEWDGGAWTQVPAEGPSARIGSAVVYDGTRGRLVLFGGTDDASYRPALYGDTWELHLRGEGCASGAECDSAYCVDGVCCDDASCGTCSACNLGDHAGLCTPVTDAPDPDTCSGVNICSRAATCGLSVGQACTSDTECAGARCGTDPCNRVCL